MGRAARARCSIELKPLSDAAAARVAENLLGASFPADIAARIVAAAEGNPLYVEQILAMLVDTQAIAQGEDGRWVRGPSSTARSRSRRRSRRCSRRASASSAANERYAIEPASVIGLQFAGAGGRVAGARSALAPGSASSSRR